MCFIFCVRVFFNEFIFLGLELFFIEESFGLIFGFWKEWCGKFFLIFDW